MKIVFALAVFVFILPGLFPKGKGETGGASNPVAIERDNETDMVEIDGMVRVYGNEPHTFAGIVDQNGVEYAVYPPEKEEELRALQGHLIKFYVIFDDVHKTYGSLFLKGGTVIPIEWEITR